MRCICPLRRCPARGDRIPVERLVYSRISSQPLRIVSSPIVTIPCLKELKPASCSRCRGPSEQTSDRFLAHRLERLRGLERLVENFQAVDARYHGPGRQVEGIMQALDGRDGFALADNRYTLPFVSLFADVIPTQADSRDFLSSPPQSALGHSLLSLGHQSM